MYYISTVQVLHRYQKSGTDTSPASFYSVQKSVPLSLLIKWTQLKCSRLWRLSLSLVNRGWLCWFNSWWVHLMRVFFGNVSYRVYQNVVKWIMPRPGVRIRVQVTIPRYRRHLIDNATGSHMTIVIILISFWTSPLCMWVIVEEERRIVNHVIVRVDLQLSGVDRGSSISKVSKTIYLYFLDQIHYKPLGLRYSYRDCGHFPSFADNETTRNHKIEFQSLLAVNGIHTRWNNLAVNHQVKFNCRKLQESKKMGMTMKAALKLI